ncbi:hypothetical protein [Alkalicoccus daliensis]|uniref:RNA polymerase sigma factor 70 region 1.1 domain-containing protein n=1 Tax=Alkalicoccus daliensis TaxID=745820 RepID=A0A1H0AQV0_9BACI|nr:hypothetical protein [Alkalicoccus daliensis]SDN35860.1 hypothetical protein SAMN04488053_101581 [Alkalicoccus daliensis]
MTRDELVRRLEDNNMSEALELLTDAEKGGLEELELAPSIGLLRDEELNDALLSYLKEQGVEIIYVNEEDE